MGATIAAVALKKTMRTEHMQDPLITNRSLDLISIYSHDPLDRSANHHAGRLNYTTAPPTVLQDSLRILQPSDCIDWLISQA